MKYFEYIAGKLAIGTNLETFACVYGTTPKAISETQFNNSLIRVHLSVCSTDKVFESALDITKLHHFSHFYAEKNAGNVFYDRSFLFGSKLRFAIKVKDNDLFIRVNKAYLTYVKYRFLNIHAMNLVVSDLINAMLLQHGYATLHCAAVRHNDQGLLIIGPPGIGKTVTAVRMSERANIDFVCEDIAITDGTYIYPAPYTSTYRVYGHASETWRDKWYARVKKVLPFIELFTLSKRTNLARFVSEHQAESVDKVPIGMLAELKRAEATANEAQSSVNPLSEVKAGHRLRTLNKYNFNYHKAPVSLVLDYFNDDYSTTDLYAIERQITQQLVGKPALYTFECESPLDFETQIYPVFNRLLTDDAR